MGSITKFIAKIIINIVIIVDLLKTIAIKLNGKPDVLVNSFNVHKVENITRL